MRVGAHHTAIHAQRLYLCPHAIQPDRHIAIRLEMIHRAVDRPLSTRTRTPSKRASRTSQEQPRESGEDAAFGKCQPAPQAANAAQPLQAEPLFLQRGQVLLVEMVVLLHEEHIRTTQHKTGHDQIDPVSKQGIRAEIDESQGDNQLDAHIQEADHDMAHPQLIGHQLIRMLAVRLPQMLVQLDAMRDRQAAVHAIHQQQHQIRDIPRLHDEPAQGEQHDERDPDAADIPREALRLALRAEIEPAEHQHAKNRHHEVRRLNEAHSAVQQPQRHQHRQRIPGRDPVDPVHEIDDIRRAHANDQRENHNPPHIPMQDPHTPEHQRHRHELRHQPDAVRQRTNIVPEAHARDQHKAAKERQIGNNILALRHHQHRPRDHAQRENHPASPQHDARVRAPLVGLVNDVALVCNLKVQQLQRKKQHCDDYVYPNHITSGE